MNSPFGIYSAGELHRLVDFSDEHKLTKKVQLLTWNQISRLIGLAMLLILEGWNLYIYKEFEFVYLTNQVLMFGVISQTLTILAA